MNALTFSSPQIALVRRTVAKDCNQDEFDLFIELCKARGLNPLLRHCYAFVFGKNDQSKRQMVVVVSIDGQRSLAERTGAYRPDERAPRFANGAEKDTKTNPQALTSAEVTVYKHAHGEWFPVTAVAYWEEVAPLKEIWAPDDMGKRSPTGRYELDPSKDAWRRMPRLMLAKCAEMAALRKAFPDDFSGLYGEGEVDRADILDLTPSEAADAADKQNRLEKIGGSQGLIVDWLDGNELQSVPVGRFADQCLAFLKVNEEEPATIRVFQDRNRHAFRQFWAAHPSDALAVKKEIERLTATVLTHA